jgi:hypothetical protein
MSSMVGSLVRPKYALAALAAVSVAGAADVGEFLAARPQLFTEAPGRAAGSVLGLAIWIGLLGLALRRMSTDETRSLRRATLALAALNALGNVGLTFIHFKAGVGGWRPVTSGLLGLASLALALLARPE